MSNIGTVKWYNPNKGYGFITPEDQSKDIFVHSSTLEKSNIRMLIEGQKVSYNEAKNKGRMSAVNIKTIDAWFLTFINKSEKDLPTISYSVVKLFLNKVKKS